MKNTLKLCIITLFTLNSTVFCMFTKITTTQKRTMQRNYITTSQHHDPQQGRRDAYQKWSSSPITWTKHNNIPKKEHLPVNKQEDAMAFYKQFNNK